MKAIKIKDENNGTDCWTQWNSLRHKTRIVSSWCKQSNLIYYSMRRFFSDLFPRLGRIVIEGDFDLHTRAASKYDDRRVIHLPAFKIWWVQGRVLGRLYQSQYRRPLSLFGRASIFWAGGREFKSRPDPHPRSYATTSCKNTSDTLPSLRLNCLPMTLRLWSPSSPYQSCQKNKTMLKT